MYVCMYVCKFIYINIIYICIYIYIYTHTHICTHIHTQLMPGADVVIDFSLPEGTKICAKRAEELGMYPIALKL
jgi:hypothetical protein